MTGAGGPPRSRVKRLLWFAVLWTAGVVVVAALAYGIRIVIGA